MNGHNNIINILDSPAVYKQCMTCFTHDGNKLVHDTTRHAGKKYVPPFDMSGPSSLSSAWSIYKIKRLFINVMFFKCYVLPMLITCLSVADLSFLGIFLFFLGKPQLLGGFVSQAPSLGSVRARLHQTSKSIWSQRCDDVCDTVLIDHNRVTPKWVATPFWSNSICFHCGQ